MSAPRTSTKTEATQVSTLRRPAPLRSVLLVSVVASVVALALGVTVAMGLWYRAEPADDDAPQDRPSLTTLAGQALTGAQDVGAFVRESAARDLSRVIDLLRGGEEGTLLGVVDDGEGASPQEGAPLARTESRTRTTTDGSDDRCVDCPTEVGRAAARPTPERGAATAPTEPSLPAHVVFDRQDAGVIPPLMQRVRLRSAFRTGQVAHDTSDEPGLVEVVVSIAGTVESAKFVTRPLNVHESMLLSAVKTWRFRPAMRNGRAIRYRLMVPISRARI